MAQSVTFKARLGSVATAIVVLILSLMTTSCSNQHPYDEAIELIKAKEYAKAIEALKMVAVGDSLAGRAKVAIAVCEMGDLYLKKEYEKAQSILLKTEGWNADNEEDGYYSLNLNPNDPLFPHAATLAHLVMAENIIQYWDNYKQAVDRGEYEEMGTGTISAALWLKGVTAGIADASYSEVDHVRSDEDLPSVKYPPYICSIGLTKLTVPEELSKEFADMKGRLEKTESLQQEIDSQVENMSGEYSESSDISGEGFYSDGQAMNWLTQGTGGWITLDKRYNSDYGVFTRSIIIFKGGGEIVMGNVDASNGNDVGRLSEGSFSISYTEGNTIHLSVGDAGKEGTMQRVSDDRAIFNGTLEMMRVTKNW